MVLITPKGPRSFTFRTTLLRTISPGTYSPCLLFHNCPSGELTGLRPGFRERLVFSNCEILTDRFFRYFASCFRLSWPHSISNAYQVDPGNALYSFSEAFSLHLADISKWKMSKTFFSLFPTLEEDMTSENATLPSYFTSPSDNSLPVLSM